MSSFSNLPINIKNEIYRHLLTSPTGYLKISECSEDGAKHHPNLHTSILRVCHMVYEEALPIMYGENYIAACGPSFSRDFDIALRKLPGRNRQLIRKISLPIDWADELWTKFPAIAAAIGELKGLEKLRIHIFQKEDGVEPSWKVHGTGKGPEVIMKREGAMREMMLNVEKKVIREMAECLPSLQSFRLHGFEDALWAANLSLWVRWRYLISQQVSLILQLCGDGWLTYFKNRAVLPSV